MDGGRRTGGGILRNTAVVAVLTACSRALGLVREMMQSRLIGAGWEQSAFTLAFAIPNMARRLFGEGALTAAFVPVFKGMVEEDGIDAARKLARSVLTMSLVMLGAISALVAIAITTAMGFHPWRLDPSSETCARTLLILRLTRILVPYMIFICGAAFGMGVLNSLGRFAAAASLPCILNIFWIGALACISFLGDMGTIARIRLVSITILFAGVVQMAFMFWCMHRRGMSPGLSFSGWKDEKTRLVWRNTAIAAIGAGAVQINYMLDQVLAQLAAPWAAGAIGYADRLMELPLGIVGTAFGTVLLPTFSGLFAKGDGDGARSAFVSSTRNMMIVVLPAAAGLVVLAPEITRLIYRGGLFDELAVTRVSRAVACYSAGLCFFCLQKMLTPWFQAQKDLKTPLRIATRMVLLNAILNIAAVFMLPSEWRHVGLAGSTVLCAGVSCALLAAEARQRNGSMGFGKMLRPVSMAAIAAAVMSFAIIAAKQYFPALIDGTPVNATAAMACMVAGGAAIYLGTLAILARRDLAAAINGLRRRGAR